MYNNKLHFHFSGIGGSGMSGLAEILLNIGFKVSGSDLVENSACIRLKKLGATVYIGHQAQNLSADVSLLVYSSAVRAENPEVIEAKRRGLAVIPRAEVLAELMRLKFGIAVAGSHGKTTTTSLIAAILEAGKLDPTVVIGGQVRSLGSGGKLGKGEFLVAESDESDKSFLLLKPTIAIITNIDSEHLSAYASFKELEDAFASFARAVPFYGLGIFCIDDARVRALADEYKGRKITYGFSPDAQVRAVDIEPAKFSTGFSLIKDGRNLGRIDLPMLGKHIVCNSLAAIAVGLELDLEIETIRAAVNSFQGVGRRLEPVGQKNGITIINDYGHHPTEVRASIEAVREGFRNDMGRLHVVFQPHRYTRTRDCFAEFISAFTSCDNLLLTEIYSAGESKIDGISGQTLASALTHPHKQFVPSVEEVPALLVPELRAGDVVLTLGAGSIGALPELLLKSI